MSAIPKIIHQIWFQGEAVIPEKYNKLRSSFDAKNPEWRHEYWDQVRIEAMLKSYPEWEKKYNQLPLMIQKIDFAKYVLLYENGGVYVDMDILCVKPLDTLIEYCDKADPKCDMFLSRIKFSLNNHIIGTVPKHKALPIAIAHINPNHPSKYLGTMPFVLYSTGPKMFTGAIREYEKNEKDDGQVHIVYPPSDMINPLRSWNSNDPEDSDVLAALPSDAVVVHFYFMTWHGWNKKKAALIGIGVVAGVIAVGFLVRKCRRNAITQPAK